MPRPRYSSKFEKVRFDYSDDERDLEEQANELGFTFGEDKDEYLAYHRYIQELLDADIFTIPWYGDIIKRFNRIAIGKLKEIKK